MSSIEKTYLEKDQGTMQKLASLRGFITNDPRRSNQIFMTEKEYLKNTTEKDTYTHPSEER